VSGIVFAEEWSNLNSQYFYPVQFSRLICRRRKRNKTGVLHRVFADRRTERWTERRNRRWTKNYKLV